jgi:abortive infection bacteriophage resistance protein
MEAHMVGFSLPRITILARNPFRKPARELEDLTFLLATRGLKFDNWAEAHTHLEHIGYYRFTGYLRPFKIGGTGSDAENFKPGTSFELVHDQYIFDRKLRILILEAVEKIEIAARAAISDSVACRHGPHWYMDRNLFARPNYYHQRGRFDVMDWHANFIDDVKRQIGHGDPQRRDKFISHYYDTYVTMQILLSRIWSNNEWAERLRDLIHAHPAIPIKMMGFPLNWEGLKEWSL